MPRYFLKKLAVIIGLSPLLSSCIVHRAEVTPVVEENQRVVASAMGNTVHTEAKSHSQQSALPEEIPATSWLRDEDGNLLRGDVLVQTARPWWQRFPADLITDLLPFTFTVERKAELQAKPLPSISREELDEAAKAFGFPPNPE